MQLKVNNKQIDFVNKEKNELTKTKFCVSRNKNIFFLVCFVFFYVFLSFTVKTIIDD